MTFKFIALPVPMLRQVSIEGEESEEREGSALFARGGAGGFLSWALLGSFLLLFTVFLAPRPENENAKFN